MHLKLIACATSMLLVQASDENLWQRCSGTAESPKFDSAALALACSCPRLGECQKAMSHSPPAQKQCLILFITSISLTSICDFATSKIALLGLLCFCEIQ